MPWKSSSTTCGRGPSRAPHGNLSRLRRLTREGYSLQESLEPVTTLVEYTDDVAWLPIDGRNIAVPMHPFLGTIGVAPRWERRTSFSQCSEYLGDVDLPAVTGGARLVLPVNADGGLLCLGDGHGAQGDGEKHGCGYRN